ncbi:MAG TPA: glycosyltransferase family 2 protein [Bacteroidia bacterium]|jgi:glycosyltransferase involved in cell wall biosynthesis|nr:glycosyltransferase family 2 protein [Bacteroidia bacterium]
MKVSGFTIVRNAIRYDYPVVEAILSILPLCDEVVVAVGKSEDDTLNLIRSIPSGKIKIIETVWDDSLREGGRVLADETNKALHACVADSDWCFYIQGDEVIHEKDHAIIREAMLHWKDDKRVEGLLFDYIHFYGSYDYTGDSRRWYTKEIRIVRNLPDVSSYRDAQGFRLAGRKLNVMPVSASVYHYGWVKPPELQQAKQESFHKMWHDDEWMKKNIPVTDRFDYSQIDSLERFRGSHPAVMQQRIRQRNWEFSYDPSQKKFGSLKARVLYFIQKKTGWKIGEYKNYRII